MRSINFLLTIIMIFSFSCDVFCEESQSDAIYSGMEEIITCMNNEDFEGILSVMSEVDGGHSGSVFNSIIDGMKKVYPDVSKIDIGYQIFLHWAGYVEWYKEYFNNRKSSDETLYDFASGVKSIADSSSSTKKLDSKAEQKDKFHKCIVLYIEKLNEKLSE